jgi:hypothetical protein
MSPSHRSLSQAVVIAALAGAGMVCRPSQAADLRMTVERPHFTCEGDGRMLSHVVYRPGPQPPAAPLPCCDGKLGCAQFLSTSTVVHPVRHFHG